MTQDIAGALRAGIERLRQAGVPDPVRDARLLMAAALGRSPAQPLPTAAEPLGEHAALRWAQMLDARARRQPVAQILGRRAFWRHEFRVTPDTLDPRPETELLVVTALGLPWRSVLDLGTGTGAILLSLLDERPGATGLGTDLSASALQVARENAAKLGVQARFMQADWFDGVDERFDLILSNPPYIAADELAGLSPEVRQWEPLTALTDHADGLSAYRAIAAGAPARLQPGGHLLVEIGPAQAQDVADIFRAAGLQPLRTLRDLDGRDRAMLAGPIGGISRDD